MKTVTIKENHLFEKCYRRGRRWSGRYLTVYTLPDYRAEKFRRMQPDKKKINRWGLTVTKRVGGAVVRSRVRRILREAVCSYRKNAGMPKLRTGFLVVLAAKESAARAKTQDILGELIVAFQKVGLSAGPMKEVQDAQKAPIQTPEAPEAEPKDSEESAQPDRTKEG